jgi:ribonuclease VapC
MVVDTSALTAILLDEPEALAFASCISGTPRPAISAVSYVEFGLIAAARRGYGRTDVDQAMARLGLEVVEVSPAQAQLAVEAFVRYGKGRHPARLNYGDCFAYALAKERGQPLLYKGQDFARTDVTPALLPPA